MYMQWGGGKIISNTEVALLLHMESQRIFNKFISYSRTFSSSLSSISKIFQDQSNFQHLQGLKYEEKMSRNFQEAWEPCKSRVGKVRPVGQIRPAKFGQKLV